MNKLIDPILFIVCLFIAACSDDNENEPVTPFSLDKNYYETRLGSSATSISITNGSGDISLAIENEDILQAIYSKYNDEREEDNLKGNIQLNGMQKGSTTLTITDNITKEKETVEVKVTDCYLAYGIAESNHPSLKAHTIVFFINNPKQDFYIFTKDNIHGQLYKQPIAKGCYEFFVMPDAKEEFRGIPCLRLTYNVDEKRSTSDKTKTVASYDFQLKQQGEHATSKYAFDAIHSLLNVDWEKLLEDIQTKSKGPIDITMTLIIPDTDYQTIGVISPTPIPEHILD